MTEAKSEYAVEKSFIEQLSCIGYQFIKMSSHDDLLANLREQISKVNRDKLVEAKGEASLSDAEFERVKIRLLNHTVYESAKILREKWILDLDNGKSVYLEFLTEDYERNTYQVTHQVTMDKDHVEDVSQTNRYDVTVLINGLPLVQIELKRPGVEINEAVNQINRYRTKSFFGLFKFIQVFVVSNSVQTKYFANENDLDKRGGVRRILKSLVFYWTDENNKRINTLAEFAGRILHEKCDHRAPLGLFRRQGEGAGPNGHAALPDICREGGATPHSHRGHERLRLPYHGFGEDSYLL